MRTYPAVSIILALILSGSGCSGSSGSEDSPEASESAEKAAHVVGDIDGDHVGDIVGSGRPGEGAKVLRSDGTKLISGDPGGWGEWTESAGTVVCDFDADGRLDTAQVSSKGYVVFYQTGEKSAPIPLGTGDPAWQVSQTFCGDFDGDDLIDIALSAGDVKKPTAVRAYVLRQAAAGTWEEAQQWIEMPLDKNGRKGEFLAGDWDGDNRTDLLLATAIDPEKETPDSEGASRVLTAVPALSTGKSFEAGAVLKLTDIMLGEGDRGTTIADEDGMQGVPADVDGDGSDELVKIGLDGWHDTYSLVEEGWDIAQTSQTEFEGSALLTRASSDVNGDHFGDVVALNREGKVVVYLGGEDGLADGVEWPQLNEDETIESECAYGASSPVSLIC